MANSGGVSNENDSQIKRHRRLPLELQCEAFSALPFQHGRRLLLLLVCHPIATNCVALVRKQKKKFENRWDPTACHDDTTNLFVDDFADDLFPFVMLAHPGDKIEANFGPNFKFYT
uniref:Uncharacterized protein n=1 Tax=Globodera rostochiensis TaxID=31243 RepID=A0A914GYZ0_GLORO